jgi:hypothetical protein
VGPVREHLVGLRPYPRDRPDLIAEVQLLADRLLVAALRGFGEDLAGGESGGA